MNKKTLFENIIALESLSKEKFKSEEKEQMLSSEDIALERGRVDIYIKKEELEGAKQDRAQRKQYADKIFLLVAFYLISVYILIILSGVSFLEIDSSVLIAIVTTTTANVIALFTFVAKYLFHPKN